MGFKIKKTVNGETVWNPIKAKKYTTSKTIEYTGTLPITISADGNALLDYRIYGNTVQTGTPTPENPVDVIGCGVRTRNIIDVYSANGNKTAITGGLRFDFLGTPQCITIDGQSNSIYPQVQIWGENGVLQLENEKTYTGLIKTTNKPKGSSVYMIIQGYDAEGNWSTIKNIYSDEDAVSFSISNDYVDYRYVFVCQNSGITYDNMKAYLMIVEGSTSPETYEPYGYKLTMTVSDGNTVQTVPVYLGERETTRRIKKLVLTGEETWDVNFDFKTFYTFVVRDFLATEGITCACSHYLAQGNAHGAGSVQNKRVCFRVSTYNQFYLRNTDFNSVDALKSYLQQQYAAGTPVTVWYVLAEPKTGIVNEPLMKIGDYTDTLSMEQAGVSIPTASGSTVIDYDGTLKPSQMYVKYNSWSGWSDIDNYKMDNGDWTQMDNGDWTQEAT